MIRIAPVTQPLSSEVVQGAINTNQTFFQSALSENKLTEKQKGRERRKIECIHAAQIQRVYVTFFDFSSWAEIFLNDV